MANVRFNCDECRTSTQRKDHFTSHWKSLHSDSMQFRCDLCRHWASRKSDLVTHWQRLHSGVKVNCDDCHFQSNSKRNEYLHWLRLHSQENGTFSCDLCRKGFMERQEFYGHHQRSHEVRPTVKVRRREIRVCDRCQKCLTGCQEKFYNHWLRVHKANSAEANQIRRAVTAAKASSKGKGQCPSP